MGETQKSMMILGAGVYQAPLIQRARERGLRTVVLSIPGHYPGFALADQVYYVNTTDREAVLRVAREERIDAVATTGTDVAVISLGHVCRSLHLPGIGEEAATVLTDKALMKEAFRKGGVTTAKFLRVRGCGEALRAAEEIGYPVVLKIVDKSGSRGITKINGPEGMKSAWEYAQKATDADHMLVEEFVSGKEIGIDALIQGGRLRLLLPHDKYVYHTGRIDVPAGHFCPMAYSPELYENMRSETEKVIRSTGMDDCCINIDAFVLPDGRVSVIEAAGRCGATGIPEVISGYTGRNYYDCILDLALGIPVPDFDAGTGRPTASRLICSDRGGVLKEIRCSLGGREYQNTGAHLPGIGEVHLNCAPGDRIEQFQNGTALLGMAVLYGDSSEALRAAVQAFGDSIRIEVEP